MDQQIQIERILEKQRAFFATGKTKEYGFRQEALLRLTEALQAYEEELCEALYLDLHKSAPESYMAEIGLTRSEIRYLRRNLYRFMRPHYHLPDVSQLPAKTYTVAEPYGVTLIMAPWNYPVLLTLEPLADALAAGNCVILKPSAYAPHVSAALQTLIRSIFPSKYVAVIEGGREENGMLLEQRFDHIFFTGSVTVGKLVLEKAARFLTPVTLELGGKSPCIVDQSADLKMAARRIVFGKLINAGQTCVAPDYLLVHEEVKDAFLSMLKEELIRAVGPDALNNPDYPRIINRKHFKRLQSLMAGETIFYGGRARESTLQIAPTVLTEVTHVSPVMQEEIFGPLLPVMTYRRPEEVRRIINSFEKPLAFYLFTKDQGMKEWALRTFSFGGGCINNTIVHLTTSHMPFGGVGASGMGSYHGRAGFEAFSHEKAVVESLNHPDIPLKYQPYTDCKDKLVRIFYH